ncbi:MAG: AmmeMemoRadiSam system radical SAM enzyme [Bacilli bacterium]|jgi:pyruvate formate lyase activating enzyme
MEFRVKYQVMKEALLYEKLADDAVRCHLCGHHCLIRPGNRGLCRVRSNINGVLYALNYGLCISAAIDPIEKKPLYHFLPRTKIYSFAAQGCNLHCPWCQNYEISQMPNGTLEIEGDVVTPSEHVERALKYNTPSIAYTYSEPTIFFEYALETMKLAKEKGIKNVWVSNGFMSEKALQMLLPYLDAVNIDIKGPNDSFYQKHCGGNLTTIIDNLKIMQKAGIHIEITTLLIPGLNDRPEQIEELAKVIVDHLGVEVPWHINRFFPAWKMSETEITPVQSLLVAKAIGINQGIKQIHLGNV